MGWTRGLIVAAFALFAGAGAKPSIVTNPDWLERPDGTDVAALYPTIPAVLHIEGRAVLSCDVTSHGSLESCTVPQEQPKGLGFAEASLSLSKKFRMSPKSIDGKAIDGGTVRIPIRYILPSPESMPPVAPPTSAGALAAAERLAIALEAAAPFELSFNALLAEQDLTTPGVPTPVEEEARAALRETAPRLQKRFDAAVAAHYAS